MLTTVYSIATYYEKFCRQYKGPTPEEPLIAQIRAKHPGTSQPAAIKYLFSTQYALHMQKKAAEMKEAEKTVEEVVNNAQKDAEPIALTARAKTVVKEKVVNRMVSIGVDAREWEPMPRRTDPSECVTQYIYHLN